MVIPPWGETAEKILEWAGKGPVPHDKWVLDALRGTMWLRKWRGSLSDFLEENSNNLRSVASDTSCRLRSLAERERPLDWDKLPARRLVLNGVGLGTYGWKYNLEILFRAAGQICLLDTAEGYGFGRTEKAIGEFLQNYSLRALIASKFNRTRLRKKTIVAAYNRSRDKLGKAVDLYQLHWPIYSCIEQVGWAFNELREEDLKYIGLCNVSTDLIETYQHFLVDRIDTVQVRFNGLDSTAAEVLIPYCRERGINVIAYSPLGQDFKKLKAETGVSSVKEALKFITDRGAIPIPRTNNPAHLEEILDCSTSLSLAEDTGGRG